MFMCLCSNIIVFTVAEAFIIIYVESGPVCCVTFVNLSRLYVIIMELIPSPSVSTPDVSRTASCSDVLSTDCFSLEGSSNCNSITMQVINDSNDLVLRCNFEMM